MFQRQLELILADFQRLHYFLEGVILSESKPLRLMTFFSIYALQGWIAGFSLSAVLTLFTSQGLSLADQGRFGAIVGLPWILQFFWGPVVDGLSRFAMGKRRFWIVTGILLTNLSIGALLFIPVERDNQMFLAVFFMIQSIFAALLDVAADGLIVDQVPEQEMGLSTSVTRAGFIIGTSVSGALFVWSLSALGQSSSILLLLFGSLFLSLLPVVCREKNSDSLLSFRLNETFSDRSRLTPLRAVQILKRKLISWDALLLLMLSFSPCFLFAVARLHLNSEILQVYKWSPESFSQIQSMTGLLAGTIGAYLVGKMSDRYGYKKVIAVTFTTAAAGFLLYGYTVSVGQVAFNLLALSIFLTATPAIIFVVMMPAILTASRGAVATSFFTFFMTSMNFGEITGGVASSWIVSRASTSQITGVYAAVFLMLACLVPRLNSDRSTRANKTEISEHSSHHLRYRTLASDH